MENGHVLLFLASTLFLVAVVSLFLRQMYPSDGLLSMHMQVHNVRGVEHQKQGLAEKKF